MSIHDANRHASLTYGQLQSLVEHAARGGRVPNEVATMLLLLIAELDLIETKVPSPDYLETIVVRLKAELDAVK